MLVLIAEQTPKGDGDIFMLQAAVLVEISSGQSWPSPPGKIEENTGQQPL